MYVEQAASVSLSRAWVHHRGRGWRSREVGRSREEQGMAAVVLTVAEAEAVAAGKARGSKQL